MFFNYIKTAWRSLWKNKAFSLINIMGLILGIASSILLFAYVGYQLSYDRSHKNGKDIYRVSLQYYQNNNLIFKSAENYSAVGPALKKDFPDVLNEARLYNMGAKNNCVFNYKNEVFKETEFLYADPSFLTMFSFPFAVGDPATALDMPNTAVISASEAKKIFGSSEAATGKYIQMDDDDRNSEICKITGVFQDIPQNSHLQFKILFSYSTLDSRRGGAKRYENDWNRKDFYTYILLRPGTNPASLAEQFSVFVKKYAPEEQKNNTESRLVLQPLEKIHLTSNLDDEAGVNGNEKTVVFLIIIAVFIISIAWINYINLTTAGSIERAKEIGIRKVLGSSYRQLVKQFLIESLSVNGISFLLAVILVVTVQPFFHNLLGEELPISILFSSKYGLTFIFFLILGSVL
ncbi:MAG TPA: ABC transporter permease, partial [Puia sp.]|nr:ABC transporter permease [Puia sp.]